MTVTRVSRDAIDGVDEFCRHGWSPFRDRIDGQQDVPTRWSAEDPDGEFRVSDEDSLAGIIAASAGNHAQGVALAARIQAELQPDSNAWTTLRPDGFW